MATLIYVDQENGVDTILGPKGVKMQPSAAKVFSKQPPTHSIHPGKVFNASKAPAERKGLGNAKVNIDKGANVSAQTKPIKKPTIKASAQNTRVPSDAEYPEIEKFFPYDPLDFELFDVPEEHKLSHLSLAGVQLQMVDMGRFERHVNLLPSPLKTHAFSWEAPAFSWESDILGSPFPCLLEEVNIDLPPLMED